MKFFKNDKKEGISERKGEISLQFTEFYKKPKNKMTIFLSGTALGLFILMLFLGNIVNQFVLPALQNGKEIHNVRFIWGNTEKEIEKEGKVWKQADANNKVAKINEDSDYVRIQVDVDAYDKAQYFRYFTSHSPSKVLLNGKKIYDGKYGKEKIVGNNYNSVLVEPSDNSQTMDIFIYAPSNLEFQLQKTSRNEGFFSSIWGFGLALGFAMLIFSVIFIVVFVCISLKNLNIVKAVILSLTLFNGAILFIFHNLSMSTLLLQNSVFFNLCFIFEIYFSFLVAVCALICMDYKIKLWQGGVMAGILFASLFILMFRSPLVLFVISIILALILCLVMFLVVDYISELAATKTPHARVVGILFMYISVVNIYDIITFTSGNSGFYRVIPTLTFVIYAIVMFVVMFKQSVNETILLRERKNQAEENSVWFSSISKMMSDIINLSTKDKFAIRVTEILTDIIERNEMLENQFILKEEADEKIHVKSCIALKKVDGTFVEIYNKGEVKNCDYKDIARIYKGDIESTIRFASTYMDMVLIQNDEVQIVIHFENFTNGLSELFQNIICTARSNIMTVFFNYNMKNEINTVQEQSIITLSEMVTVQENVTKAHLYSVSAITKVICEAMEMPEEEINIVSMAAVAHDIGKIAIAPNILQNSHKLSDEEFEMVKQHVVFGYNILSKSDGKFMKAAAIIAHEHHEKYNGSGYLGIVGENIHLYARIVAVADVFDALISKRSYKKAWTPEEARKYILERSGIEFDPYIVKKFDAAFDSVLNTALSVTKKYND